MNPYVQRISLIALDQMPGGNLKPEYVTPLLASTNALLNQTAHWIVSHHPEWAGALAGFLKERLTAPHPGDEELSALQPLLVRFARNPAIQELLADAVRSEIRPSRLVALRTIAGAGYKRTPPELIEPLKALFTTTNDREVQQAALSAVRALPDHPKDLNWPVYRLAWYTQNPPDIRLQAYAAVRHSSEHKEDGFKYALQHVASTNTVALRSLAATLLAIGPHSEDELHLLTRALPSVGPVELPKLLAAYHAATNETVGLELLDALKKIRSLQAAQVRPNLTNFPASVRAKADVLLASLNTDAAKQKAQLDEMATKLLNFEQADIRRGQALFNGQKAACSTCHAIGYLGGNLGPDLTRIGQVRTERDLLESIVFPSASFVRSFEPLIVVTKSGDEHSGIVRRDASDEVVLATGPTTEEHIARADILELRAGTVSVMPQGLDQQLTRGELADLLAFLKATKW